MDAPLPFVFGQVGAPFVKTIVTTGAIFALFTRYSNLIRVGQIYYQSSTSSSLDTTMLGRASMCDSCLDPFWSHNVRPRFYTE